MYILGSGTVLIGLLLIFYSKDAIVNVDACFTQKHSSKAGRDPPHFHPGTFFLPKEDVVSWKQFVDSVRPQRQEEPSRKHQKSDNSSNEHDDHFEGSMHVLKLTLDGCLASFTAADEACIKGSTKFFDVTANMMLLCCHDRPLFSVNMNTSSEGQHYTLALVATLFDHLPPDFTV